MLMLCSCYTCMVNDRLAHMPWHQGNSKIEWLIASRIHKNSLKNRKNNLSNIHSNNRYRCRYITKIDKPKDK